MLGVRFSIIIACEHGPDELASTLAGVRTLEYPEEPEILVADDARRPDRAKAAEGARYLHLPGASRAEVLNLAVREAKCEYLAFLEDGCVPCEGWLSAHAFDVWTVGAVGGPDRASEGAGLFETGLDYVLTSFSGTMGVRTGWGWLGRYYPRPWNSAARKESVVLAGGFDPDSPEAPEVAMMRRMEKLGYTLAYSSRASVRRRQSGFRELVLRDYRLSRERAAGEAQPGLTGLYSIGLLALLLSVVEPRLSIVYAGLLAAAGAHAWKRSKSPGVAGLVPFLLAAHHGAHLAGFTSGLLTRLVRR
ncbi:MAG: glycosyltransferase family 2 protein [Armatimonadota bacterium]